MQRRSLVALIAGCAVTGVSIAMLLAPRSTKPCIAFTVLAYSLTNRVAYSEAVGDDERPDPKTPTIRFTTSPPRVGVKFQQYGTVLLAHVRMKNTGRFTIVYESQSDIPGYQCRLIQSSGTNNCIYFRFSGGDVILEPGKSVDFRVWLPPDVQQWQVGFDCGRAAWRRVFAWRHRNIISHLPHVVLDRLARLPGPPDDDRQYEVWSEIFRGPESPKSELHNKRAAGDGAIRSRLPMRTPMARHA